MHRRSRPTGPLDVLSPTHVPILLALALSTGLAACSDSDPVGPGDDEEEPSAAELTVDASESWASVQLFPELKTVAVADLAASDGWDLAFLHTQVIANGAAAGPGGVQVHCLCENAGAGDAAIVQLDPTDADALFDAADASDLPDSDDDWLADELEPAMDGWFAYDFSTHQASPRPDLTWKLRLADDDGFAKLRIVDFESAGSGGPSRVLLEYAVQTSESAPMGPVEEMWVEGAHSGTVRVDLPGGEVSASGRWDLEFEGWTIRLNGGASGEGGAGAYGTEEEEFEAIENAGDLDSRLYAQDALVGGFGAGEVDRRWYRYDLEGNHQIWPTYNVYLVRRGDEVMKVQILSYYGSNGDARQITLRAAPLEDPSS